MGKGRLCLGARPGYLCVCDDAFATADRSVRYVNLAASSSVDKEKMLQGLAQIFGPFFVFLMNVAVLILLTLWIRSAVPTADRSERAHAWNEDLHPRLRRCLLREGRG